MSLTDHPKINLKLQPSSLYESKGPHISTVLPCKSESIRLFQNPKNEQKVQIYGKLSK